MLKTNILLLSASLFGFSAVVWIMVLKHNRPAIKDRSSYSMDCSLQPSNKKNKADSAHLHYSTSGATSVDKASKDLDDPIAQIECEIIKSEVNPMVRRIDKKSHDGSQSLVIGIAGGSGSGKTTLSRAIVDALGKEHIAYISHDSYYKDLSHLSMAEREVNNFDDPSSLETDLLTQHVQQLKGKRDVEIPIYSFETHSRIQETEVIHPRPIILVEGILIFTDPQLIDLMDIKIFVDTDDDIRMIRRLERDVVERGRSVQKIIEQYLRTVRPMHLQYVQPSKKNADIIVPFGLNSVALDLVISKLKHVLDEADGWKGPAHDKDEATFPYLQLQNGMLPVTKSYQSSD